MAPPVNRSIRHRFPVDGSTRSPVVDVRGPGSMEHDLREQSSIGGPTDKD